MVARKRRSAQPRAKGERSKTNLRQRKHSSAATLSQSDGLPPKLRRIADAVNNAVLPQWYDKRPSLPWKKYQKQPPSDERLESWAHKLPRSWAIICGQPSGHLVFDFDGSKGAKTMKRLGLKPLVKTPSGGFHVHVRAPDYSVRGSGGLPVDAERWPGMELKADGNLATTYGQNSKGPYELIAGGKFNTFANLPKELRLLLKDRRQAAKAPAAAIPQGFHDFIGAEDLLKEGLERVEAGASREPTGFWLSQQLRNERIPEDKAKRMMNKYADTVADKGDHLYTHHEAYSSLRSAYNFQPGEPRKLRMKEGIVVNNRPMPDVTGDAVDALQAANEPPRLFRRKGEVVRLDKDENDQPIIVAATSASGVMKNELGLAANWVRMYKDGPVYVYPPNEIVQNVLATASLPFPGLEAVVEIPVLREDGSVLDTPGYDAVTHLYYQPANELNIPRVPNRPTTRQVKAAISLLLDDVLVDFPFVAPSSRANALALILTPVIRQAAGVVPLALSTAPKEGTGKSFLGEITALLATGRNMEAMPAPGDGEEWRKQLLSSLRAGSTFIAFDNVDHPLRSGHLERALTTPRYADRILGVSKRQAFPQRATWFASGNNLRVEKALKRRCYWIIQDTGMERPWAREESKFKHPDLMRWIREHRGELVAALLTVTRSWFAKDCPKGPATPMDSANFGTWAKMISGILANAGVEGFLGNMYEMYDEPDPETEEWGGFLQRWREVFANRSKSIADISNEVLNRKANGLYGALPSELSEVLNTKGEQQFRLALGYALRDKQNVPFGGDNGLRIVQGTFDSHRKVARWRVGKGRKKAYAGDGR